MLSVGWEKIYSLAAAGRLHAAVDEMYETIDDLYYAGQFDEVNALLESVDLRKLGYVELMVSLLTVTLPVASKLPARPAVAQKIREIVTALHPDRVDFILKGLRC